MTEQEAATQQVREAMISCGILYATRLRDLRAIGTDFKVAALVSGGLAIVLDNDGLFRLGPPHSTAIVNANSHIVERWNRQSPAHSVALRSLQGLLESECSRIFLLLHEIEKSIERRGV